MGAFWGTWEDAGNKSISTYYLSFKKKKNVVVVLFYIGNFILAGEGILQNNQKPTLDL